MPSSAIRSWAGEYDQRLTICKNVPTVNADGQKVEVESEWIRRWASVIPIRGVERFLAQQTTADVTHIVRMRSDTQTRTIVPDYWIKLRDGTRLDIKRAYDRDLRKMEIEMECNERK